MRKFILVASLLLIIFAPVSVQAQNNLGIETVTVSLWPEHDRPSMLVLLGIDLLPETALPVDVVVNIPKSAEIWAVAFRDDNQQKFYQDYTVQMEEDWQVIRFTATDSRSFRIEYYDPLTKDGIQRQYTFVYATEYPVGSLIMNIRQPTGAKNMNTLPAFAPQQIAPDGVGSISGQVSSLKAGEEYQVTLSYTKESDDLTVSGQPLQPTNGTRPVSQPEDILPWVMAMFGGFLIIGGIVYFLWSGRTTSSSGSPRKRHGAQADAANTGNVYCHECGKRANNNDRFCRNCGTRLRI